MLGNLQINKLNSIDLAGATARYCETSGGIKCYNDEMCYNLCSDSPGCRFTSGYCRSRDSTCVCLREKTAAVSGEKANDGSEREAAAGHGGGSGARRRDAY